MAQTSGFDSIRLPSRRISFEHVTKHTILHVQDQLSVRPPEVTEPHDQRGIAGAFSGVAEPGPIAFGGGIEPGVGEVSWGVLGLPAGGAAPVAPADVVDPAEEAAPGRDAVAAFGDDRAAWGVVPEVPVGLLPK